ncbi:SRPBCC domain-containing protein [Chitinophaga solisilvae]|uniref:SRPBCC domain-containing protein n=1 Tax=Chitinophaga solisilvae TaxID=1233460 RepID=UPI00136EA319|nr:SRPBCC domain-containing protein [Chitinophaga solisilvae]
MSKELFVRNNITINAPAAAVWDALVNPARTKQYMFGCETVSDWKKGSELLWKMIHEGKELIAVKGNIEEIIPGKRLIYTTIDPNSDIDDTSEKYLQVTYDLTEDNGQTLLQVSQGNYATVNEGERRFREAEEAGGWSALLEEIKKLVEAN